MKTTSLPDGLNEHTPGWHFKKLVEFTDLKHQVGEPSPHLAIVGWLSRKESVEERVWRLGCYGATYCLPSAQVIWSEWPLNSTLKNSNGLSTWLSKNWKGIVTRTERRCVRTQPKMFRCLKGWADWIERDYGKLPSLKTASPNAYYDAVWESVTSVPFMGRYISIRLIEGLKRYANVPAALYDVRSIGGWSPKKAMVYLYPEHANQLLTDSKEGNDLADELTFDLLDQIKERLPYVDAYILAAMLCEYREAYERRHQYPAWTIDQEPLLYDKVTAYFGTDACTSLWDARKALFPKYALGELGKRWWGTRWDCASTLRNFGYNWSDLRYDYTATQENKSFASPIVREEYARTKHASQRN